MRREIEYKFMAAYAEARSNTDAAANKEKWRNLAMCYLRLAQNEPNSINEVYDPVWELLDTTSSRQIEAR